MLALERVNGSGVHDCYLETRYNATVNLTDDAIDRYTLLVTYDGVLVTAYFADPNGSGASHGLVPESRYAPWVRNVTGNGGPESGSGGASAGRGGSISAGEG